MRTTAAALDGAKRYVSPMPWPANRRSPPSIHPSSAGTILRRWPAASRNVVFLGLTSLLTDVSSESLTAVLPLYLVLGLHMTPMQFGLLDGLQHGATALVRVAGGLAADARGHHKMVAWVGYAVSALCKLGLLLVGAAWGPIASLLLIDRLGKGIRTAPRDALLALSSEPAHLAESFGVHRTFDTVGAVLGPVLAFAVLAAAPGAYDAVFVASFAAAVLGLAVLGLFVSDRRARGPQFPGARPPHGRLRAVFATRRFPALLTAGGLLGLLTASDAMIYLVLQQRGAVPATVFPLLFVGTATSYLLLAVPAGRLGDRWGRHRVFLLGHLVVLLVYILLLRSALGIAAVVVSLALLGAYYAATDGVLAALASSVLDDANLTTGLAVVGTTTALARLLASSLFGALWTWHGPAFALALFAAGLLLSLLLAARLFRAALPWMRCPTG